MNYIDKIKNEHDIASVLVDQTYDMIEQKKGRAMLNKHKRQFGEGLITQKRGTTLQGESNFFNAEELFYLNRIAFRLFKERGFQATFIDFINDVKKLQSGELKDRVNLWLSMMLEAKEYEKDSTSLGSNVIMVDLIQHEQFL